MFSVSLIGCIFALHIPLGIFLSQIQSYLYIFKLLILNLLEKGSLPNNTIAPLSFIMRLYCSHNGSKGIITSHLQSVVPYGKSHRIMSIDFDSMYFIASKQSAWIKLFG